MLVARHELRRRVREFTLDTLGVLLAFLLRLITGAAGGNDPFEVAMRSIVRSVLAVPLRNGLILLAAGAVLIVIAVVLNRVERMTLSPAADAGEDW